MNAMMMIEGCRKPYKNCKPLANRVPTILMFALRGNFRQGNTRQARFGLMRLVLAIVTKVGTTDVLGNCFVQEPILSKPTCSSVARGIAVTKFASQRHGRTG